MLGPSLSGVEVGGEGLEREGEMSIVGLQVGTLNVVVN